VYPKNKRVDAYLALPFPVNFDKSKTHAFDFSIPLIAVEVKTNLDKNMISGIMHSAEKLKATFPKCRYYVLSEFSDFNTKDQNYANSDIDEIYILRKQKRSEYRASKKANDIALDLILDFINSVNDCVIDFTDQDTSVGKRLTSGYLIGKPS
jgi:hypothetical protein